MFKVVKSVEVDGFEFELVEHVELKKEAIRMRFENAAGRTSRSCPTIWLEDLPSYIKASILLLK